MQVTPANFTSESRDSTRQIATSALVSWKKQALSSYRPFTIGVSSIGGNDPIASQGAVVSDWNKYVFFDESAYLTGMAYERGLKMPTGGLTMGQYELDFDNTSRRFTPSYMGGHSELFTAVAKVMRPTIINAGFNYGGIDNMIPQFVGLNDKSPLIDTRNRSVKITGFDFMTYLQNKYLDTSVMFTSQTTDQPMKTALTTLGFGTSQYKLDTGINTIPFGMFEAGTRFSDMFDQLAEAEGGQFYQDEFGVLRFENRQHWYSAPHSTVQKVIQTAEVLEAQSPNNDHLINVVEIKSPVYEKQAEQIIYKSVSAGSAIATIAAGASQDVLVSFSDPALSMTTPVGSAAASYFKGNSLADGTGTDQTGSLSITSSYKFAQAARFTFNNSSGSAIYLAELVVTGRIAKHTSDIYYRAQDGSSVTAYQERPFTLTNQFIQNFSWAQSYANLILQDFSEPENLQKITIRAKPDLQLGDLISWQGHYWRLFDIKTTINPSVGFIQELSLLQRYIASYFTIGISTIGGTDQIAP